MKILVNGNFGNNIYKHFSLISYHFIILENAIPSSTEIFNSNELPPGNLLTAISDSIDDSLWGIQSKHIAKQFDISALLSSSSSSNQRLARGAELAQSYRTFYE